MLLDSTASLAFIGTPSASEMLLVAIIALLVYGKDLPNVARQWGKAFQDFRRHLNGIRSELNDAIYAEPERPRLPYQPAATSNGPTAPMVIEGHHSEPTPVIGEPVAETLPAD